MSAGARSASASVAAAPTPSATGAPRMRPGGAARDDSSASARSAALGKRASGFP
jgi:hypothetical protein